MKTSTSSLLPGKYWNSPSSAKKSSSLKWLLAPIWAIAVCWALGTLYMETQARFPVDRAEWGHRAIGWFVSIILIRTFLRGIKRIQALRKNDSSQESQ